VKSVSLGMATKAVVTYFAPCDPRQGMGGGARLNLMLRALESMSLETYLFSYDGSGTLALSRETLSPKTRIFKISVPRGVPKAIKLMTVTSLVFASLALSRRPSIVVAHSPGIASGLIGLVVSRLTRASFLVDHMDSRDPDTPEPLYRLVLRSADVVFAISHRLEKEALEIGARKIVYLPIFLDLDRFPKGKTDRSAVRSYLNIGEEDFMVGYFGSFSRLEGLPVLLEAFSNLCTDMPEAKLLIVGARNVEGADDVELIVRRRGLGKNVILLGPQPYARVPSLMQAADVLVAPKIRAPENEMANPIKIYEYLASEIPCITSMVGEASELVRETEAAFVVEPDDPEALERAIRFALKNRAAAITVAKKGRALAEQRHSLGIASCMIRSTLSALRHPDQDGR